MVEGPPDDLDEERPEDGPILSPDELDITESEHVEQLDEGRFVVSPDGPPNPNRDEQSQSQSQSQRTENPRRDDDPSDFTQQSDPQRTQQADTQQTQPQGNQPQGNQPQQPPPQNQPQQPPPQNQRRQQPPQGHGGELTEEGVHRWLRRNFEQSNSKYAFDVTATFEGSVSQRRMASNDVVTIFESLVLWYAQQVDSNTPVEEILGILLRESNVPIRYPPETVHRVVKSVGLGPDDSIADLLEAIQQEDGVKL